MAIQLLPVAEEGTEKIVVRRSRRKLALPFLACLAFAAIAGAFAAGFGPEDAPPVWASVLGCVLFSAAAAVLGYGLVNAGEDVLTITAEGICDRRLSGDLIPWSAVENVTKRQLVQGQEAVALALREADAAQVRLTPLAGLVQGIDRAAGLTGLVIGVVGLTIEPDRLIALIESYHARHGAR